MKIEIFGMPTCSFCTMAKQLLSQKELPYEYNEFSDLTSEEQDHIKTERAPSAKSFPIIFIDDVYIGGFNNLKSAFG